MLHAWFLMNKIKVQSLILCLVLPFLHIWKLWLHHLNISLVNMNFEFIYFQMTLYRLLPGIRKDSVKSEQEPAQQGKCQRNNEKKDAEKISNERLLPIFFQVNMEWVCMTFGRICLKKKTKDSPHTLLNVGGDSSPEFMLCNPIVNDQGYWRTGHYSGNRVPFTLTMTGT